MKPIDALRAATPPALWGLAVRLRSRTRDRRGNPVPVDSQLSWLRRSVPGWLDRGNLSFLDECIRSMPDGAVVEIGSYAGLSLATISHLLAKHGRGNALFSADPWNFEAFRQYWAATSGVAGEPGDAERRQYIIDAFSSAIRTNCRLRMPFHLELSSDDFFAKWHAGETMRDFFGQDAHLGGPIALAYIDGDHTYEQSMRDFLGVDRHLARGGFIVFDDSADSNHMWGCGRTAREAAALPTYRLVDRRPNYCIQKI
ncbi:MAG: class I SAM-dependent methyltransferase [Bauldia sp.]